LIDFKPSDRPAAYPDRSIFVKINEAGGEGLIPSHFPDQEVISDLAVTVGFP
jgi:hypothetical protein